VSAGRLRLDEALVERGLIENRSKARALILAGDVLVNGEISLRAGAPVAATDTVTLRAKPPFVSRGGEKLAWAIEEFQIDPLGHVCADIGASTGGFTDCLLQNGASRVYAIDVGYGQLDSRLRNDQRVVVMERLNARYLDSLPEAVSIVTIDVSFISLKLILPVAAKILTGSGLCVPLIKPQFEAGRREVGSRGVVRDPTVHCRVIVEVLEWAKSEGLSVRGLTRSPILGPEGNVEFLGYLTKSDMPSLDAEQLATKVLD
jgi:23S rRNA (cytidine1920-2'-O)/16S rRNA (cytidine1409-2'-O)-methyltransferase